MDNDIALFLLDKYTHGNPRLRHILVGHSQAVRDKAMALAHARRLGVDLDFVSRAAMLHDIGVVRVDAPSISCLGTAPYICHGVEGRAILEAEGLPIEALVCERHTGSGLSAAQISAQGLPLPHRDMLPLSLEEKLICYADKFFSKSRDLRAEKPVERIMEQMAAHGREAYDRFMEMHAMFG